MVSKDLSESDSDNNVEEFDLTNIAERGFKIDFTPKKKLRSEIETYRFYLGISIMLNILLLALSLR